MSITLAPSAGTILRPGDPGWDGARQAWNLAVISSQLPWLCLDQQLTSRLPSASPADRACGWRRKALVIVRRHRARWPTRLPRATRENPATCAADRPRRPSRARDHRGMSPSGVAARVNHALVGDLGNSTPPMAVPESSRRHLRSPRAAWQPLTPWPHTGGHHRDQHC